MALSLKARLHKNEYNRLRYQNLSEEEKEKRRAHYRKRYAENMLIPEKRQAHRDKNVDARYRHVYGMARNQKNQMYLDQNMLCEMCSKLMEPISNACVDHNHTTGAVRGLLCFKCNTALGYIEDKQIFENAKKYLKKYEIA